MTLLLTLLLFASPSVSPPDTLASLYAQNDSAGLVRLHKRAHTASDELLYRYRLYPLTLDARYLEGIPEESDCRTARDFALLAALWAYRAAEAPPWKLAVFGMRSDRLLERARALDPEEPYVLLVDGQSLLYRPGLFGGSSERALQVFERLRTVLRQRPTPGISPFEPEVWIWYTLQKLGRPNTDRVRDRLLAKDPPPLFRQFLIDPP
ncbi:MAG: hypothetical protein ABJF88_13315 [Rhodothermales bacterium]